MKTLRLPKKIRVGTRWYSVDVVESMRNKSEMGRVDYVDQKIELARRTHHGVPFRLSALEDTFWHELTHAILHNMGEHELNERELFVEEFARRLSAAIRTARF
jgi:hypothetical protein